MWMTTGAYNGKTYIVTKELMKFLRSDSDYGDSDDDYN